MSKLNLLFVWSARGTRGQQSHPAFARIFNNVPNIFLKSFVGRIALSLTAASRVFRRMKRQTRLVCTILLLGIPTLLLAGCGGGGGGSTSPNPPSRAVSGFDTTVSGNNITVRWTNPNQAGITGFNVSWVNAADEDDGGFAELNNGTDPAVNLSSGASDNRYTITNLTYRVTYNIIITVLYESGDPAASNPEPAMTAPNPNDFDEDGVMNAEDSDYDGDGLIEIRTLDALALLRDDLNGDGADDGNNDTITVEESMGCPADGCIGYELMRSLDFSDAGSYADENNANMVAWTDSSGSGWTPIGSCTDEDSRACEAYRSYSGIFEGNHHNISNLFISIPGGHVYGTGLFAAFNGTVRNLNLVDARVRVTGRDENQNTGLLVGYGVNGTFINIAVSGVVLGNEVSENLGALAGDASDATIFRSIVKDSRVEGRESVGGLVGLGDGVEIIASYVANANLSASLANVGGLIGETTSAKVTSSYVTNVIVTSHAPNGFNSGGLIGFVKLAANITHSYALGGKISGGGNIGGLIGRTASGGSVKIDYSYVALGNVSGGDGVGGLIGSDDANTVISVSYWDTDTTGVNASQQEPGLTTAELQMPARISDEDRGFANTIYATWGNFWCDPDTGEVMESSDDAGPGDPFIRVWDLGTSEQYPALNCVPGGTEAQRPTTP